MNTSFFLFLTAYSLTWNDAKAQNHIEHYLQCWSDGVTDDETSWSLFDDEWLVLWGVDVYVNVHMYYCI